jgi:hypothetical protein
MDPLHKPSSGSPSKDFDAAFQDVLSKDRQDGRMMKRAILLLAPYALCLLTWGPAEAAGKTWPNARAAIESRSFLVGTWRCSFTVGDEAGVYTTTWSRVLDGLWLKQSYDQPKQPRTFAFRSEYFIGYDSQRGQWVRFGAMTTGQYFAIRMVDTGTGGWRWTYVSFFGPRKHLPPSGYDATFTRKSDTLYTVDGPTYPKSGAMVTEHHVCRKS